MATNPSYKHSNVFASLKDITETLKGNLTTSQYLQIYDEYLENAILPVILGTNFFDVFISRIVGWQEKNFRRKVTFLDRAEVPGLVVNFLLQATPEKRIEAYKKLSLDRGVCVEFLRLFQDRLKLYLKACSCELVDPATGKFDIGYCLYVKKHVEETLRCKLPLRSIYLESEFWLERALAFKQVIMEKYVRLCLNTAQKDYVNIFKMEVELDDIIQYYLMAASRAIDKCDYKQGVLTRHIQNWFLTARTRVDQIRDRRKTDISIENVDFNSEEFRAYGEGFPSHEDIKEKEESNQIIRQLARIADPIGVARAYLGIEESLKDSEIKALTKHGEVSNGRESKRNRSLAG